MSRAGGRLTLAGMARDLVTVRADTSTAAPESVVIANATVEASVDEHGCLASLAIDPFDGAVSQILGRSVAGGFRDAVQISFPDDVDAATPVALLLDDLPVAALISGYALLYSGEVPADDARAGMKSDICSGWRSTGTMMQSVRAGNGVPVTIGPTAPNVPDARPHDPLGWHPVGELADGAMRRRRMIDVRRVDGSWLVDAMFRDTHVQPGGSETVLHEYSLTATVDEHTRNFVACAAVPRVLPWVECPVAAASADRLVGQPIDSVREFVRREFRGTSTCTHLNDLLRSLGDVPALSNTLVSHVDNRSTAPDGTSS